LLTLMWLPILEYVGRIAICYLRCTSDIRMYVLFLHPDQSLTVEVYAESDSKHSQSDIPNGGNHDHQKGHLSKRRQSDMSRSFNQTASVVVATPVRSIQRFWKSNSEETDCDTAPRETNPNTMDTKNSISDQISHNDTLPLQTNLFISKERTLSTQNGGLHEQERIIKASNNILGNFQYKMDRDAIFKESTENGFSNFSILNENKINVLDQMESHNCQATRMSFETIESKTENNRLLSENSADRKTIIERSRHARRRRSEIREKLHQSQSMFKDNNDAETSENIRKEIKPMLNQTVEKQQELADFVDKLSEVDVCAIEADENIDESCSGDLVKQTKARNIFNAWKIRNRDDTTISEVTNIHPDGKSGDVKYEQPEVGNVSFVKRIFGGKRRESK
jgi:hypothetical protein